MRLIRKIGLFQFSTTGLRVCGMIFLALATFGTMMQTRLLGAGSMTSNQLLNALEQNPDVMLNATIALLLQMIGSSALPIFVFLLVEGAVHTSDYGKYFLRVLGLAILCQLPYQLVATGSVLRYSGLNPVFALVLCMAMLYFFRRFQGKGFVNVLMKVMAVFCLLFWGAMLGVAHGPCCVILCTIIWTFREKQNIQTFLGIMALFVCCIFALDYLLAPVGFLITHFYEGKQGSENRLVNYLAYPVILLAGGLLAVFM